MRRPYGARSCVAVALMAGLAGATVWWVRGSPLERVAPLPAPPATLEVHGRWLVHRDGAGAAATVSPIGGGPARRLEAPAGLRFLHEAGIGDTDAFYTSRAGDGGAVGLRLYQVPLDGSPGVVVVTGEDAAALPGSCVVVGGTVYWLIVRAARVPVTPPARTRAAAAKPASSALWSAPVRGGPPRRLLTGTGTWSRLRAGDTGLVWEERTILPTTRALHYYRLADGQHVVWRHAPTGQAADGMVEWRGCYYGFAAPIAANPTPPALVSFAPDGTGYSRVWSPPGPAPGSGGTAAFPTAVMQHRGRLFVLLQGGTGRPSSLCEVTVGPDRAAARTLARLPPNRQYQAYCDDGYCYVECRAPASVGAPPEGPEPGLYRVNVAGGR